MWVCVCVCGCHLPYYLNFIFFTAPNDDPNVEIQTNKKPPTRKTGDAVSPVDYVRLKFSVTHPQVDKSFVYARQNRKEIAKNTPSFAQTKLAGLAAANEHKARHVI